MTNCSSPPCGATLCCSAPDLNPPIITFVGRLHVSQKGLDTFLEAIALIEETGSLLFSAWIIGGSLEEAQQLRVALAASQSLKNMHEAGRLMLWGRVAPEALAEIYSRSTVLAMPSRRETFGLVAVQAMLCGVPVVAASVGGLRHTVVPRRTGVHINPGDSCALAFVLRGLARHRALTRWLGFRAELWASRLFSPRSKYGGFSRILASQGGAPVGINPLEDPPAYFAAEHARDVMALLRADQEPQWIPSGHNSLFNVTLAGRARIAKRFTDRPDFDGTVYRLPDGLNASRRSARFNRSIAVRENAAALAGEAVGDRLLLYEVCDTVAMEDEEIVALADAFAAGPPTPYVEEETRCRGALEALVAQPCWSTLDFFDRAAASLNAPLSGDGKIFVRCHPFAELTRLKLHLESQAWPLSQDDLTRLEATLARCDESSLCSLGRPQLRHGDLSRRHVLKKAGVLILCDLEQARFAYGDLDRAGLAVDQARVMVSANSETADAVLARAAVSDDSCAWIICELIHRALGSASWGKRAAIAQALALCEVLLARVRPQ